MSTTEARARPPARCAEHGDNGATSTITHEKGPLILRQHRCASGCDTPLGWDFNDRERGTFHHGPGQCEEPGVENEFKIRNSEEIAAPIIGVAVTNACVIAGLTLTPIVAAVCGNGAEAVSFVLKSLAISVPLEAACLAALWALRRSRPIRAA